MASLAARPISVEVTSALLLSTIMKVMVPLMWVGLLAMLVLLALAWWQAEQSLPICGP